MTFTPEQRRRVFDRTSGCCHLCHETLSYANYNKFGSEGAWNIDHSRAQARGGSHHGNNLYAAHISCNSSKQASPSKTVRRRHGLTRPPHSKKKVAGMRTQHRWAGGITGLAVGGPVGAAIGAVSGVALGHSVEIDPRQMPSAKKPSEKRKSSRYTGA